MVNAAGPMSLVPLADFDLAVLDRMLRTNIRGTFVVDQQAARRVRPGGAIINFSSSVLGRVLPNYTGYAASKAAVEAMTFILAHELRGRDVTVNAVAPGPTATDMFLEGKDQERWTGWPTPCRSSGSASRMTSPRSSRSWPAPPGTGSTARQSGSTAASSDAPEGDEHAQVRARHRGHLGNRQGFHQRLAADGCDLVIIHGEGNTWQRFAGSHLDVKVQTVAADLSTGEGMITWPGSARPSR